MQITSSYCELLKNRINLIDVPFTDRGSRLLIYGADDRLSIRLAERWIKRDLKLAAYRTRPPILDELQLTDENGTPLELNFVTYPHAIICETNQGEFHLAFLDQETLVLSLPETRAGVTFLARVDQVQTDRRGGVLKLTGEIRRSIAYTTNARVAENKVEPVGEGVYRVTLLFDHRADATQHPALLLNITPRLGFNRYVPDAAAALEAAAQRWDAWFAAVPEVVEEYRRQYFFAWWVMRAGLISTRFYITREAMTPSKMYYVGVWQWDSYFHALAYRHVDMRLAYDQIRVQLDHQQPNGMIPDAVHDEGVVTHLTFPVEADVTKPPLVAWTAMKLYQQQPDPEFLDEIYEPMCRWNAWWFEHNDTDGNGLCEYLHPFSSGLDDSPLWDEGVPVESPDLNTYLCLQQESLAEIAAVIGQHEDARKWAERAEAQAARMIREMWDPQAGLFWARRHGQPIRVRTPFNLFPLITGRMPEPIAARLVEHLTDPQQFWPRFPVPTVALDDPRFDPLQMWRGPTWVNVNYLLVEGLRRSGHPELARELGLRTLALMGQQEDIYEYYHPETGENPPKAAPIFGWSSALFIDLAIQMSRELEGV